MATTHTLNRKMETQATSDDGCATPERVKLTVEQMHELKWSTELLRAFVWHMQACGESNPDARDSIERFMNIHREFRHDGRVYTTDHARALLTGEPETQTTPDW